MYEMPRDVLPDVLTVDDDDQIRLMLHAVLADAGYQVHEASNGGNALAFLRARTEPLLVLLDLMMPGMRGDQVLRAVERDTMLATRHAYVLMTAASPHTLHPVLPLLARLQTPVLLKPFEIERLLALLAQAADRLHRATPPPPA